jgi:cell division protein FtsI/penicillin-binding protein 2
MMAETVRMGSARRLFHQRGYALRDAAGKTGSLSDKHPVFRDYTWFVGFAPRENPKVAVAAVVVNGFRWRIKGTYVGREALRMALKRADQNLVRR